MPQHPAKKIAKAAQSGAAVTIIEGLATGMLSAVLPVILVAIATVLAYVFGDMLGIAIASMGMIINLGMLLAMDCYGPIADNAAGISEMAGLGKEVRERCEALDAVGNTTAALGKGFAIASAALAGQGRGRGQAKTSEKVEKKDGRPQAIVVDRDGHVRVIREYAYAGSLPPGLAKREQLPPGLRKQLRERGARTA